MNTLPTTLEIEQAIVNAGGFLDPRPGEDALAAIRADLFRELTVEEERELLSVALSGLAVTVRQEAVAA